MNEVGTTNEGDYAVMIDHPFDALLLRDVCRKEAQRYHDRWVSASTRHAVQKNLQKHEVFARYAERFEHIRVQEVNRIIETMKGDS